MPIVNYLTVNGRIISQNTHSLETATTQWIIPDPQGSVSKLVNSSGEITDSFYWWPYGEQMVHAGSSNIPLGWLGTLGYYTDASGVYVRRRKVDQVTTSWRQLDPLWPAQPQYAYVGAKPVSLSDPSGLWPWSHCGFRHWMDLGCDDGDYLMCHASCAKQGLVSIGCVKPPFSCRIHCICLRFAVLG